MGRRLIVAALVAIVGAVGFQATLQAVPVYLCHRVPGAQITLIVDSAFVNTFHLNIHPLDFLGQCPISIKK